MHSILVDLYMQESFPRSQHLPCCMLEVSSCVLVCPTAAARYLVDNLDRWESFAGGEGRPTRLCRVPPQPASVAVRPFMLDSALNYIQAPSLEHRTAKEEAKSTFSRIFTWGAKK